jgi:hypothetical protein
MAKPMLPGSTRVRRTGGALDKRLKNHLSANDYYTEGTRCSFAGLQIAPTRQTPSQRRVHELPSVWENKSFEQQISFARDHLCIERFARAFASSPLTFIAHIDGRFAH